MMYACTCIGTPTHHACLSSTNPRHLIQCDDADEGADRRLETGSQTPYSRDICFPGNPLIRDMFGIFGSTRIYASNGRRLLTT